jgi:phosphoglycerate dehydrogenase-like enzyme
MRVLVPAPVLPDLQERVALVLPLVELLSYTEDGGDIPGATEAEAVFRWIAGKQYEKLVLNGSQVRWLHTASAGVDHVLTPALKERGNFTLTDSGPAFGICIGEFVLAWMLAVAHCLPELLDAQQAKRWQWVTQEEIFGQTVGIIGLGPVGRGIAERCRALGMHTIGLRRSPVLEPTVHETVTGSDGLNRLLQKSDWVVLAAASTPETRALLGAEELARMKPNARLINVARGALVDEAALIAALQTKQIAGACLDVFAREPLPQDSPLWEMPNVYITPHTSPGWTEGLKRRQLDLFVANLQRFTRNERLEGIVDFERGY